ncbi:MAG: hypothetical protein V1838_03010 [Patescibacteria group bacterium]
MGWPFSKNKKKTGEQSPEDHQSVAGQSDQVSDFDRRFEQLMDIGARHTNWEEDRGDELFERGDTIFDRPNSVDDEDRLHDSFAAPSGSSGKLWNSRIERMKWKGQTANQQDFISEEAVRNVTSAILEIMPVGPMHRCRVRDLTRKLRSISSLRSSLDNDVVDRVLKYLERRSIVVLSRSKNNKPMVERINNKIFRPF